MLSENLRAFVAETRRGVLTTFRRSGGAQMSIVTCGPYREGVAFTTTARRAKLINLRRNPRCSLLVSQEDWAGVCGAGRPSRAAVSRHHRCCRAAGSAQGRLPGGFGHGAF